jgi:hypothetical protein
LKKDNTVVLGILGLLILVVVVSGCTSSSQNLNSTFSSGTFSFNYPSDWTNGTSTGDIVSGGTSIQKLGTLVSPNGVTLLISGADLSSLGSNVTISEVKDLTKQNLLKISSTQILSDNSTTVNGVKVYELTFTFKDPNTNKDQKSLYVVTGKDGQTAYYMQFIADTATFDQNQDLINQIINTIKN